jgi:serine/threonine-protein kinase
MGMIIGTAAYMSPEQAKGKVVDKRADIWAFGVVLFEMLAGERAFKGEDVSDVLAAVLRQEIDWNALPADTPRQIRRVLARCLQRDPKKRLRDIGDVWIENDAPDEPAPAIIAAPAAARASGFARALPWIAAGAISGGVITWAAWRPAPESSRQVVKTAIVSQDVAAFIAMSRDGSRLAYASGASQTAPVGISLRMLDQFEGRVVPGTEGGVFPFFSPDGKWLAYNDLTGSVLRKIPIAGGTAIKVCDCSVAAGADWGDDNTIVFRGATGLMRVSGDGGTPETLTTVDTAKGEVSHTRPQFLPGGKAILFTIIQSDARWFAVKQLGKDGYRTIAKGGFNGKYVESGHLVFLRNRTLFALPVDLATLTVTGSEVPVVEGVSTYGPAGTADYAVSRTGLLAFFSGDDAQRTTLAWADRAGATKALPGASRQVWGTGRLSPNGRLVVNGITDAKGNRDIWTFDVDRGTLTRLTFGDTAHYNDNPVWGPDNHTVYYNGRTGGKGGVYSVPVDASAKPTLILATDTVSVPTSVSADGKTLAFHQGPTGKLQIWLVDVAPTGHAPAPRLLHDPAGSERDGEISPDGRWIAYQSNESDADEIYVLPYPGPGPKVHVSLGGGLTPRWTRDGRELLYWANIPTSKLMTVAVTATPSFQAGQPKELFQQLSTSTWDTTPDANRFLVERSPLRSSSSLNLVVNWFDELRRLAPAKK